MKRNFKFLSLILWCICLISAPNRLLADESSSSPGGIGRKLSLPNFAVSWHDGRTAYQAGDIAVIKIKILDETFSKKDSYVMHFFLSVCGKKGNSSYISAVFPYLDGDPAFWNVSFTPIRAGEFSVVVTEDNSGISDSSLHFFVTPGTIYPCASQVSWVNLHNEFVAGKRAFLSIVPKDAFGNNISSDNGSNKDYFMVSASYENGTVAVVDDFNYNGWSELGYILSFVPVTSGSLLLHVTGNNYTLNGSPLTFDVKPGSMNYTNSMAKWKYGTDSVQIFSKLEVFIHQKDQFGNPVPGFYSFDARVVEKTTNLSVPVADLFFQEVGEGVQLLSFIVTEPGDFMLTIFNAMLNESIADMPFQYTVFTGYCHGLNSFINGSDISHSVSGRMSCFSVYLEDLYHNPSPIEARRLHIQISNKNSTSIVQPVILPWRKLNATAPSPVAFEGPTEYFPALPDTEDKFIGDPSIMASEFNVTYIPEKSGEYEIWVFCGNIPLNDGCPYSLRVSPGMVDTSKSSVINYAPKVKQLMRNAVIVQLVDTFSNPVSSDKSKLTMDIDAANSSSFMSWAFVDNGDGSYVGYYLANDIGTLNMCISYEKKHLSPCPFEVQVYEINYFSEAHNDSVSVWEDESVAFDVLANDYIPGGQYTITEWSMPRYGSLLQYGKLLRYTPYKGFFGNDSFSYSFSDTNQNVANGTAFIYVLCKPPQGFSGFELMYSDLKENITLKIRPQSGIAFLAPQQMQLWHPFETTLLVSRGGRTVNDLILSGPVGIVNYALQSIQYLGNENFYGNDIICLYTINNNGIEDARVPVFVEPINDPPMIHAPQFIFLGEKEASEGVQIFDKQRDVFEFSIGDADIFSFPGNKSQLVVTFSVEVDDGALSTSLPVHLIKTAELKSRITNQWQPLQTFVTISSHFFLKGKGIRFQGTIGDCNSAMQRLFYHGTQTGAMLTITVNDLGNYGCYPDCINLMSAPLFTEAAVNLIRRRSIGSSSSLLIGSIIVLEIVLMLLLGGALLVFICKCMSALHLETRERNIDTGVELSERRTS